MAWALGSAGTLIIAQCAWRTGINASVGSHYLQYQLAVWASLLPMRASERVGQPASILLDGLGDKERVVGMRLTTAWKQSRLLRTLPPDTGTWASLQPCTTDEPCGSLLAPNACLSILLAAELIPSMPTECMSTCNCCDGNDDERSVARYKGLQIPAVLAGPGWNHVTPPLTKATSGLPLPLICAVSRNINQGLQTLLRTCFLFLFSGLQHGMAYRV